MLDPDLHTRWQVKTLEIRKNLLVLWGTFFRRKGKGSVVPGSPNWPKDQKVFSCPQLLSSALLNPTLRQKRRAVFNWVFASVLLYYALWLVRKTRATFLTNQQMPNKTNRDFVTRVFPRFAPVTRVLIGSLCRFCPLWLARVITLVLLGLIVNRSIASVFVVLLWPRLLVVALVF